MTKAKANQRVARAWHDLIVALGYDPRDAHFADTPQRVARFLVGWHTNRSKPPKMTTFPNKGYDEMVLVGGIRFHSMCAHHGAPFFGTAVVGYIPSNRIVGLSKLARVVDHFSRRFQTQEDITKLVADHLEQQLLPKGVGVLLRAEHLCMSMRGIQRPGHWTVTSDVRGVLRSKPEARAEFLSLAKGEP